jgi:hypothetical protein
LDVTVLNFNLLLIYRTRLVEVNQAVELKWLIYMLQDQIFRDYRSSSSNGTIICQTLCTSRSNSGLLKNLSSGNHRDKNNIQKIVGVEEEM